MATRVDVNWIAVGIKRLGGLHKASMVTGIPYPSLARYKRYGAIPKLKHALVFAQATKVEPGLLAGR